MYKRLAYKTEGAPCIDCDDRVKPTKENPHRCHDSCATYRAWREKYETKRNQIKSAQADEWRYQKTVNLYRKDKYTKAAKREYTANYHRRNKDEQ